MRIEFRRFQFENGDIINPQPNFKMEFLDPSTNEVLHAAYYPEQAGQKLIFPDGSYKARLTLLDNIAGSGFTISCRNENTDSTNFWSPYRGINAQNKTWTSDVFNGSHNDNTLVPSVGDNVVFLPGPEDNTSVSVSILANPITLGNALSGVVSAFSANYRLKIFKNDVEIASLPITQGFGTSASWNYTTTEIGTYHIRLWDSVQEIFVSALSQEITVNTVAVEVSAKPVLTSPLNVNGNSNITGTGVVGATIKIFKNGAEISTTTVDSQGNWSYPQSEIGEYTFSQSENGKTESAQTEGVVVTAVILPTCDDITDNKTIGEYNNVISGDSSSLVARFFGVIKLIVTPISISPDKFIVRGKNILTNPNTTTNFGNLGACFSFSPSALGGLAKPDDFVLPDGYQLNQDGTIEPVNTPPVTCDIFTDGLSIGNWTPIQNAELACLFANNKRYLVQVLERIDNIINKFIVRSGSFLKTGEWYSPDVVSNYKAQWQCFEDNPAGGLYPATSWVLPAGFENYLLADNTPAVRRIQLLVVLNPDTVGNFTTAQVGQVTVKDNDQNIPAGAAYRIKNGSQLGVNVVLNLTNPDDGTVTLTGQANCLGDGEFEVELVQNGQVLATSKVSYEVTMPSLAPYNYSITGTSNVCNKTLDYGIATDATASISWQNVLNFDGRNETNPVFFVRNSSNSQEISAPFSYAQ